LDAVGLDARSDTWALARLLAGTELPLALAAAIPGCIDATEALVRRCLARRRGRVGLRVAEGCSRHQNTSTRSSLIPGWR
jgi:hypothetical protein